MTFRKVRKTECKCSYIEFCESQRKELKDLTNMSDNNNGEFKKKIGFINDTTSPTDLEKKHVYEVYDKYSDYFIKKDMDESVVLLTKVKEYIQNLPKYSLNADIGKIIIYGINLIDSLIDCLI